MTDPDIATTAARLGVSERTIRRWLRAGRLAGYRVGGRIRIPERAVREAAAPYGARAGMDPGDRRSSSAADDPLLGILFDPGDRAAALRRRRALAAARMDELAARARPPSGPDDTVDAYLREDRAERDRHWDRALGLDRP